MIVVGDVKNLNWSIGLINSDSLVIFGTPTLI